jgi:hypothetical protein
MTITNLADELAVDPADVAMLVEQTTGTVADELPAEVVADVRGQLDPNGERTALGRYWPGEE